MNVEFRFKAMWLDQDGIARDTWVLASAYPEKDEKGNLKSIFGSITNISLQKLAEDFQRRRTEEAINNKRSKRGMFDLSTCALIIEIMVNEMAFDSMLDGFLG